jgi:D-sedoheptulose 7-phosphate isomerase
MRDVLASQGIKRPRFANSVVELQGTEEAMSTADKEIIERLHADFDEISSCFSALKGEAGVISAAANVMTAALRAGNKVFFCGNGGSAADCQHLAAELLGRYLKERDPLPAIALTVDTSALTAIGNDYGYEQVFARQLRKAGDVLVALTTSGSSPNVLAAVRTAAAMGVRTIGMTGAGGGKLAAEVEICIRVPHHRTRIASRKCTSPSGTRSAAKSSALYADPGGLSARAARLGRRQRATRDVGGSAAGRS